MRQVLRTTATALAALLAATTVSFTAADAAPSATRCRGPQYPNGECKVYFGHGHYPRGAQVDFYSDRAFQPGERVDGHLHCQNNFNRHRGPWDAGARGRVRDTFHLPAVTPPGTCRFVLRGRHTGATASGTFRATRH